MYEYVEVTRTWCQYVTRNVNNFTRCISNFTRCVITSPIVSEYWRQKYLLGEIVPCSLRYWCRFGYGTALGSLEVISLLVSQFSKEYCMWVQLIWSYLFVSRVGQWSVGTYCAWAAYPSINNHTNNSISIINKINSINNDNNDNSNCNTTLVIMTMDLQRP